MHKHIIIKSNKYNLFKAYLDMQKYISHFGLEKSDVFSLNSIESGYRSSLLKNEDESVLVEFINIEEMEILKFTFYESKTDLLYDVLYSRLNNIFAEKDILILRR